MKKNVWPSRIQLFLTAACLLFSLRSIAQQEAYVSPAGTKFLLYTPVGYHSSTTKFPLLLSLHSKGEVADDLTELTSRNPEQMPCRLIYLNQWPEHLPFVVLTPQLKPDPNDPEIQWSAAYIDEVVNYVLTNFRIDLSRIYVTGISRGGTGVWTYASAFPEKVAAILPLSGRSDLSQACAIKDIPTWAFHGDDDGVAPPSYSIDMVNAIKACQPQTYNPRLTILNARNHNGWNEVYNGTSGYRVYDWLLMFRKNDTANRKPYVNAGPDIRMKLTDKPVHLMGDFFDFDGQITGVTWRQTSGESLMLENAQSNLLNISALKTGFFEFELTVIDERGAQSSDRIKLEITGTSTIPAVTQLVLINGKTDAEIGDLSEGQSINKTTLGLSEINIKAISSTGTGSVRFSINSDLNVRTVNTAPYFIKGQSTSREWKVGTGTYFICATPYPQTYARGTPGASLCYKITFSEGVTALCDGTGKISHERWTGISGTLITSIPVANRADQSGELTLFEGPQNIGDNYGTRIRGYVCPPSSGDYVFWISGNDRTELWLSTDNDPTKKRKIAYANGYTNFRQWTKYTTQQSAPINLVAGRKYYIEALHKEGTGTDHVSVSWQLPGGISEKPIPGMRLLPFDDSPPEVTCAGGGTILREIWTGVQYNDVASIPVDRSPDGVMDLTVFEEPTNTGDNFGSRVSGYVCAPASGAYTFWIASNDNSELWLSTDNDPANKRKIAYVNGYTLVRQWTKYTSQQSMPINLVAGQQYYVEALHKEGIGSDHMAVGWQLPDGTREQPIPGNRLTSFQRPDASTFRKSGTATVSTADNVGTIRVFPNPTTGESTILHVQDHRATDNLQVNVIEVINITGEVVFSQSTTSLQTAGYTEHTTAIDLKEQLKPGIYLVRISGNGSSSSCRLVVR